MLAEKFVLYLETLICGLKYSDGSPRVQSTSPHVPFEPIRGTKIIRDSYPQQPPAKLQAATKISKISPDQ